jgi:hypothetical protein
MSTLPTTLRAMAAPDRVGDARRAIMIEAADVIETLRQENATLTRQLDASRSTSQALAHDYEFLLKTLDRAEFHRRALIGGVAVTTLAAIGALLATGWGL